MTDVTRYAMVTDITPLSNGEWVRYEDYAALAAELERVREAAGNVLLAFVDWPEYDTSTANSERQRALTTLADALRWNSAAHKTGANTHG